MEAYNYYRQCKEDFAPLIPRMALTYPMEAQSATEVFRIADRAVKFVLPMGGKILDSKLKALPEILKLPYPAILIEYRVGDDMNDGMVSELFGQAQAPALRRIVVAWEEGNEIGVASFCELTSERRWTIQPWLAFMQGGKSEVDWDWVKDLDPAHNRPIDVTARYVPTGELALSLPDWKKHAFADMHDEIATVLNLIEAMSCRNVSSEPLPVRKLNKSAKKAGALPFDEYRVLTVNVTGSKDGQTRSAPGLHRSPREHLRRGHIRRLPTGNIWVQATIVNAGAGSKLGKTYNIK